MLKIAYSTIYAHPLPAGHRFPMEKYALLPQQLMYEGTATEENFFDPDLFGEEVILSTHKLTYWERLKNLELTKSEIRKTGFPLSKDLVDREVKILSGSIQSALFAKEQGIAMNIAGGTHHAYSDRGEGFCLLNDLAVTANYLIQHQHASKVLIVDLDVHQGNGTAEIFQNVKEVFTFSMHGQSNYPMHKEKSDLDVGLPDKIEDKEYLYLLNTHLNKILEEFDADFILYQSGVDVLKTDKLGKLALSLEGVMARDKIVLELAHQNEIPIMCCMGGGYSPQIKDIIDAHAQVYRLAQEIFF
ncbi:histone deacetylase [Algoriphagus lutimaris]|uniref:histone deacetylase family protein n=1 Tax=Algoriphagus lutimaris TaxID=613197 RepID=UPI00196A3965|nr:histone deacetylase [Algoriphagus lutimaris]MBN3519050.1 histone deacetylase [Algoriphagus lutimaris]